jgi:hypothetical protein
MRGVIFWSRLHGLISLELDRHLVSMQLDPELLYRALQARRKHQPIVPVRLPGKAARAYRAGANLARIGP